MTLADLLEVIPNVLTYDGPILAFVLLLVVIRSRRLMRFKVFLDEFEGIKILLGKRQSWSEMALKSTLDRIAEVKTGILEQARVLARVRASATLSEHLDVIEKVVLVSEQLEKLKQTVEVVFQELIDRDLTASQQRAREIHANFKGNIEQTRKNLEKSVGDKVSAFAADGGRGELMGQLVNPIRHALLSVSKKNLDVLQEFSDDSAKDSERYVREALSKVCSAIDVLRRKYDEAPMLLAGVQEPEARPRESA